jgi:DNA-binding CsgD family transcriptional regulator
MSLSKKNLSGRDLKDVLLVSRAALECAGVNELRNEVLRLLEDVFKSGSSNFFLCCGSDQKVNLEQVITRGVTEKHLKSFRQYYYKLDPFYQRTFPPHTNIVTNEEVISFREFIASEYYNEFLREQSIHHEMVIYLRSQDRRLGLIALFRPPGGMCFSSEEMTKAELIAPYLAGALEKTMVSEQFMKSDGIIKSITSNLRNKGIIILDETLEPVYQNEEAVKISSMICNAEGSREKSFGGLPRELYLPCQRLKDSFHVKKRLEPFQEEFRQPIRAGEQRISVRLHLLPCGERSPLFLIYLELDKPPFLLAQSENQFGLTRREVEIVNLLYLGLKNSEISERLFISEHTVENHLKSIYQKLGVNNRTRLIHRLTHLNGSEHKDSNNSSPL